MLVSILECLYTSRVAKKVVHNQIPQEWRKNFTLGRSNGHPYGSASRIFNYRDLDSSTQETTDPLQQSPISTRRWISFACLTVSNALEKSSNNVRAITGVVLSKPLVRKSSNRTSASVGENSELKANWKLSELG